MAPVSSATAALKDTVQSAPAVSVPPAADYLTLGQTAGDFANMLSTTGLVATDALDLLNLHEAIRAADSVEAVAAEAAVMPLLFVRLVDAHMRTPMLMRVYTTLSDAITTRLIELSIEDRGAPPVAFAWLAFGSAARRELTLCSDQDNGLAFEDTDDPSVDEYFLQLALAVNTGLSRCGFPPDPHGVLAANKDWRMQVSDWVTLFAGCLRGWDNERLLRAAVGFDFRQVAGNLSVRPAFCEIIQQAPGYARFLSGLAELGAEIPSPLGFRRRIKGPLDLKRSGLLPVQNIARYYACSAGIMQSSTLERLEAVRDAGEKGSDVATELRKAFVTMAGLVARHQAGAFCAGRSPDEPIDSTALDAGDKTRLRDALRIVASVQEQHPRRPAW